MWYSGAAVFTFAHVLQMTEETPPQSRSQELSAKAAEERRRCRDWLLKYMQGNQPKFLTKAELREAAIRELKVSKNSFDFGWISGH